MDLQEVNSFVTELNLFDWFFFMDIFFPLIDLYDPSCNGMNLRGVIWYQYRVIRSEAFLIPIQIDRGWIVENVQVFSSQQKYSVSIGTLPLVVQFSHSFNNYLFTKLSDTSTKSTLNIHF